MPSSPNSFSITAIRWPWCSLRMRLSSVVLPAPRKPVRIVTGTMLASRHLALPQGTASPHSAQRPLTVSSTASER